MRAPWFGLHLRRGNSLIGARRAVYRADDVTSTDKAWLKAKGGLGPAPLPFLANGEPQPLTEDAVHQFLLPSPGWAAVTTGKDTKLAATLAPEALAQLSAWRKGILQRPVAKPPRGATQAIRAGTTVSWRRTWDPPPQRGRHARASRKPHSCRQLARHEQRLEAAADLVLLGVDRLDADAHAVARSRRASRPSP